jgi:SAM-dependent methyltransferase
MNERVEAIQQLWSVGCYEDVGALFVPVTEAVVAALPLAGRRVLDAATGTGNTAIAAARAGADVAAFDLTPRLLDVARERASAAGVTVDFAEGDLLAIPYPDDAFDVALSTFGAFTADDPQACARELVRVCRPGGTIVSTAWASDGIFGVLTEVALARLASVTPSGAPDPRAWADADGLAGIFAGLPVSIELTHRTVWLPFPSVDEAFAMFEATSGPVQRMRAAITAQDADGWPAVRAEIVARWAASSSPGEHDDVLLPGTYGVATITVAG